MKYRIKKIQMFTSTSYEVIDEFGFSVFITENLEEAEEFVREADPLPQKKNNIPYKRDVFQKLGQEVKVWEGKFKEWEDKRPKFNSVPLMDYYDKPGTQIEVFDYIKEGFELVQIHPKFSKFYTNFYFHSIGCSQSGNWAILYFYSNVDKNQVVEIYWIIDSCVDFDMFIGIRP